MVTVKCKNVLINNVINVCRRDLVTFQNFYMLFDSERRDQGTRGREVWQFWCEVWKLLLHAGFPPLRTSWKKNILMPRRPCEYISLEWFFHPLSLYACWVKTTGVVYGPDAAILPLWYLWNRSVTLQSFVIRHQKGVEWDENELIFII